MDKLLGDVILRSVFVIACAISVVLASVNEQDPVTPVPGSCLCLKNGRNAVRLSNSVVPQFTVPRCYTFHGVVQTTNGHTMYQLRTVNGRRFWVAAVILVLGRASQCPTRSNSNSDSGLSCTNSTAVDYACKLLHVADTGAITLWKHHPSGVHDDAYAYNNIRDACHGLPAARSHYNCSECPNPGAPGGHVCLSVILLRYIYTLHMRLGYIRVNEIAGACHVCRSRHYLGRAVDLHNPPGQAPVMASLCTGMGGWAESAASHVHCQFNPENLP